MEVSSKELAAHSNWTSCWASFGCGLNPRETIVLQIENLHAEIDGKPILKGLSLTVNAGEVHAARAGYRLLQGEDPSTEARAAEARQQDGEHG